MSAVKVRVTFPRPAGKGESLRRIPAFSLVAACAGKQWQEARVKSREPERSVLDAPCHRRPGRRLSGGEKKTSINVSLA